MITAERALKSRKDAFMSTDSHKYCPYGQYLWAPIEVVRSNLHDA
jgi:hypothetical protein